MRPVRVLSAAVIVLAACGSPGVSTHTFFGAVALRDSTYNDHPPVAVCSGVGGYADIREGANVTITDSAGKILAIGSLESGKGSRSACNFTFTVPKVPDSAFYGVEVAHRGKVTFARESLIADSWVVGLSL